MTVRAAVVAAALIAATGARGEVPHWAKPYLALPRPTGSYIAQSDTWIAVRHEIDFGPSPAGGLTVSHRMVMAPLGPGARRLPIAIDYDEAVQDLVAASAWVPGAFGFKEVDLRKLGKNVPDLNVENLGAGRYLLASTREIAPAERVVVEWQVTDTEPFPGDAVVVPLMEHPTASVRIRVDPGVPESSVDLRFVEPQGGGEPIVRTGEVILDGLPAAGRIYDREDPWLPHPFGGLPFAIARRSGADAVTWPAVASQAAAVFRSALESDGERAWVARARALVEGAKSPLEKAARLAAFVQAMAYRDLAWGVGAYRPESPSESLRSLSADCKGKSLLLQVLLAESGIRSTLVLCRVRTGYLERSPVPTLRAFNHVVLAIRLPGAEECPGALVEGAGRGAVLFDPTDPLATLGLPPPYLEGTEALWLDPESGGIFTVRTREAGALEARVSLRVAVASSEEATFKLTIEGEGDVLRSLTARGVLREDPELFRKRCSDGLQAAAPGLSVTASRFSPPDHLLRAAARLEVEGRIASPLQAVGGGLFTLSSPAAVLGFSLGAPGLLPRRPPSSERDRAEVPEIWRAERCCQSFAARWTGRMALSLPPGWTIRAVPSLRPVDAPWLRAVAMTDESGWAVEVAIARGRFPRDSVEARARDVGALGALFRQPYLVAAPAPP